MVHSAPDMLYSMELCSVLSLIRTHTHTQRKILIPLKILQNLLNLIELSTGHCYILLI